MNFGELLWWYLGNARDYAAQMLPCMCAGMAVYALALPVRRRRLDRLGLVSPRRRELALLLFVMFAAGLAALTLFPANFWHRQHWLAALRGERPLFPHWGDIDHILQLVPLQEIRRAVRGPWVMFLMVANIGIFLPVGVFSALLWRKPRWWKSLAVGLGASTAIESIQYFIGRSADVDDVLLNTAGALLGFWLFWLARALCPRLIAGFQCHECHERGDDNGLSHGN